MRDFVEPTFVIVNKHQLRVCREEEPFSCGLPGFLQPKNEIEVDSEHSITFKK
jgi:hypothetical protein